MSNANPWLEIPYQDYERHMNSPEVGQLKLLEAISCGYISTYKPASLAILGCCTGNGLKCIDPTVTKQVYAIDINPIYLDVVRFRYFNEIKNLDLIEMDIDREDLSIRNVELLIAGLIFEYVSNERAVSQIANCLTNNGKALVIIQRNGNSNFVSNTRVNSIKKLNLIAKEIQETNILNLFKVNKMKVVKRESIRLTYEKSFLVLVFSK